LRDIRAFSTGLLLSAGLLPETRMISRPAIDLVTPNPRLQREERLSLRAAIILGSVASLVLWLALADALVRWM